MPFQYLAFKISRWGYVSRTLFALPDGGWPSGNILHSSRFIVAYITELVYNVTYLRHDEVDNKQMTNDAHHSHLYPAIAHYSSPQLNTIQIGDFGSSIVRLLFSIVIQEKSN